MANLAEQAVWEEGIFQLEVTDAVVAGAPNVAQRIGGPNIGLQQLANRTRWLFERIAGILPAGQVALFAMSSPPEGWLVCDGATYSRADYARLFDAVGTQYGAGDGSTTFTVPDYRGSVLRAWDAGRGRDPGRQFGTYQGDAMRNLTGSVDIRGFSGGASTVFRSSGVFVHTLDTPESSGGQIDGTSGSFSSGFNINASRQVPTASEVRVKNHAVLACISY